MGNINTLNDESEVPINFRSLKQQKHPLLGQVKHLINNHDDTSYLLIQRVFASFSEYEKCLKNIKSRVKLSKMKHKYLPNRFIMEVLDYRTAQYSELCGKTYKIYIFIHNFDSNLKLLLHHQQKVNLQISQPQLIGLMLNIVNCLIELYDHNIKPFHLSGQSVIFRNNQPKLIDQQLTSQISPVDSFNYRSQLTKGTFIAPELLLNHDSPNHSKSDIFTLAILTLQLALLEPLDTVYDYNLRKVNFGKIQAKLTKITHYSQKFKLILMAMLEQFPEQRIGILRLKQNLNQISQSLQNQTKPINFQENDYRPVSSNKGLIYLGKNPSQKSRNDTTFSNFIDKNNIQNQPKRLTLANLNNDEKYSYHKLLNEKRESRKTKSMSFNEAHGGVSEGVHNEEKITKIRRLSIKKGYKETPQTNIQVTPEIIKNQNDSHENDFEDNKSDIPISPISLQVNQPNQKQYDVKKALKIAETQRQNNECHITSKISSINRQLPENKTKDHDFFSYPYRDIHRKIDDRIYQHPQLNKQKQPQIKPLPHSSNQLIYHTKILPDKPTSIHSFQSIKQPQNCIQHTNLNLQFKTQQFSSAQYAYPGIDFKMCEFPSFSLLPKTNIQQVQTPRIHKQLQKDFQNINLNKSPVEKHLRHDQTPIKSLELIQTERKGLNEGRSEDKKVGIVFGRYDFSNGAVYEGEFNKENEFQGNGVLYFGSGKVFYSGCWKKNQFHGFGILNNIQNERQTSSQRIRINYRDFNDNENGLWIQYEGQFYQDKKHGFGTLYFVNGDKFSGCFVNDAIQGFGNFYSKHTHQTLMGIWANNLYRQP